MKKSFVLISISMAAFFLTCSLNGETRVYEERTKKQVTTHRFLFEESSSSYLISLRSEKGGEQIDQKYELKPNLAAFSWHYENPKEKTKVTANRRGNKIFLSGLHKGEKINKTFKINELSWNQSFNIGLEKFAVSTEKSKKFWAIGTSGTGDMKISKFSVKKKGVERITLKGKEVEAVHVKISLSGLLSIFWSGSYWYRKTDGKFLRYKGKGGPGTSVTIMELISEKSLNNGVIFSEKD